MDLDVHAYLGRSDVVGERRQQQRTQQRRWLERAPEPDQEGEAERDDLSRPEGENPATPTRCQSAWVGPALFSFSNVAGDTVCWHPPSTLLLDVASRPGAVRTSLDGIKEVASCCATGGRGERD